MERDRFASGIRPEPHAFIALIQYTDGEKAYIIAPQRLKAGDIVVSGEKADIKPGNAMPLKSMPVGTIIHNIEMKEGKGAQMVPFRRNVCPARGPRSGICADQTGIRRTSPDPSGLHGDGGRGV
jgi:hypothetical protein